MRRTLEAYRPDGPAWRLHAEASGNDMIAIAHFDAFQLDLSHLWS